MRKVSKWLGYVKGCTGLSWNEMCRAPEDRAESMAMD